MYVCLSVRACVCPRLLFRGRFFAAGGHLRWPSSFSRPLFRGWWSFEVDFVILASDFRHAERMLILTADCG